jgi:hypothetical protein
MGRLGYYVHKGYTTLLCQLMLPPKSRYWTNIWHLDGIPKINIFYWTLAHGKIITGENLCKRGIHSPTRCVLCCSDRESSSHLFLECEFSREVWQVALQELIHKINWSTTIRHLLGRWKSHYQGYFLHKPIFKRLWLALPKFICWQIWLS